MRKMWRSAQNFWQTLAEFNTVHIVRRENASRFFSWASVKICHIPVKFFMTIANIFLNPWKANYVDLSSNFWGLLFFALRFRNVSDNWWDWASHGNRQRARRHRAQNFFCNSNRTLKAKSESGEIWKDAWEKFGVQYKKYGRIWQNLTQSIL